MHNSIEFLSSKQDRDFNYISKDKQLFNTCITTKESISNQGKHFVNTQ